jgi:hypothetical protein
MTCLETYEWQLSFGCHNIPKSVLVCCWHAVVSLCWDSTFPTGVNILIEGSCARPISFMISTAKMLLTKISAILESTWIWEKSRLWRLKNEIHRYMYQGQKNELASHPVYFSNCPTTLGHFSTKNTQSIYHLLLQHVLIKTMVKNVASWRMRTLIACREHG